MTSHTKWDAITKLCTSFRAICSRVLHMNNLLCLQTTIFETICNLEKVFPSRFFNSIYTRWSRSVHVDVSLRKLGYMKRKIKPTQRLRGLLLRQTRLNRESRNFASEIPSYTTTVPSWMLFEKNGRQRPLSDDKIRIAHNYILINYVEVLTFMRYVVLRLCEPKDNLMWMTKHLGGLEIDILLGDLKNMLVSNKKKLCYLIVLVKY
uniref:Uncharacterized protein n=1 Tax=Lactuca sativa TaxID=4236 RepID=A0A9R1VCD7_LACSA|nr:hypothetical protein LSAT_V11C600315950 [Lactuca sativa]